MSGTAPNFDELFHRLARAVRAAERLELYAAEDLPVCSTRFGGLPYRESNDWPHCRSCGEPQSFLGQIEPRASLPFDAGFKLGAFYFCRRCRPSASSARGRGFTLAAFAEPSPQKHIPFDKEDLELFMAFEDDDHFRRFAPCGVTKHAFSSVPHWEDWGQWVQELRSPGTDESWRPFFQSYDRWVESLTGTRRGSTLFTYIGGHPYWVNGVHHHRKVGGSICHCGCRMEHVLQLDTEAEAGFSFGKGCGLLNLFQCPNFERHADRSADGLPDDAFRLVQQYI